MQDKSSISSRTAAVAAAVSGVLATGFGILSIADPQSAESTTVGIEHLILGLLTATLIALVPVVLHLGARARRPGAAAAAVTGQLALATLTVVSNVRGEDPAFFAAVAVPANLLILGGFALLAIGLRRNDAFPGAMAVALPVSWILTLFAGGVLAPLAGAYWLSIARRLRSDRERAKAATGGRPIEAAATLIAAVALLFVAAPPSADAAKGLKTERFIVSVKGVQTTAWSYAGPGGGDCHPAVSGEGTEVVRFAGKPKPMVATQFSPTYVQFSTAITPGVLGAHAKVTRQAKHKSEPLPPGCVDPHGGGEIRAEDCGSKRGVMDLTLSYERFGRSPGVNLRTAHTSPDVFESCGVLGVGFPQLLDYTSSGERIASPWPIKELMDGEAGKTIVIGRGRKVTADATSRSETTIRWELTFRRVGSDGTQRNNANRDGRAFARLSAK